MKPVSDPYLPRPGPRGTFFGGLKSKCKVGIGGGSTYESKETKCKHDYEFKYMKEKITEEGKIIRVEHYFCKRCLEEKVLEKPE